MNELDDAASMEVGRDSVGQFNMSSAPGNESLFGACVPYQEFLRALDANGARCRCQQTVYRPELGEAASEVGAFRRPGSAGPIGPTSVIMEDVRKQVLRKVLDGTADANIRFDDLRSIMIALGFTERVKGSHHIFARAGVMEILNLQPRGSLAKPYQVKQVRAVIVRYKLAEGIE